MMEILFRLFILEIALIGSTSFCTLFPTSCSCFGFISFIIFFHGTALTLFYVITCHISTKHVTILLALSVPACLFTYFLKVLMIITSVVSAFFIFISISHALSVAVL